MTCTQARAVMARGNPFEVSRAERVATAAHIRGCGKCRRYCLRKARERNEPELTEEQKEMVDATLAHDHEVDPEV
jgi:hypothetical protein